MGIVKPLTVGSLMTLFRIEQLSGNEHYVNADGFIEAHHLDGRMLVGLGKRHMIVFGERTTEDGVIEGRYYVKMTELGRRELLTAKFNIKGMGKR